MDVDITTPIRSTSLIGSVGGCVGVESGVGCCCTRDDDGVEGNAVDVSRGGDAVRIW